MTDETLVFKGAVFGLICPCGCNGVLEAKSGLMALYSDEDHAKREAKAFNVEMRKFDLSLRKALS